MVRIDDTHGNHGWNWVRGHFLSMDKGTTRGLIGAQVFKVELPTRSGRQIAEFSPAGLDLDRVGKGGDLTPKKQRKDKPLEDARGGTPASAAPEWPQPA